LRIGGSETVLEELVDNVAGWKGRMFLLMKDFEGFIGCIYRSQEGSKIQLGNCNISTRDEGNAATEAVAILNIPLWS